MRNEYDEPEALILSDVLIENEEIIAEVSELIKELKNCKKVDQTNYDMHIKKCKELMMDLENIIEDIDQCQKENDPNLQSFDSKKKSAKSKAQKSKKLIEENMSQLEKLLQKHLEISTSTNKETSKNSEKNEKAEDVETDTLNKEEVKQHKSKKENKKQIDLKSDEKDKGELNKNNQLNEKNTELIQQNVPNLQDEYGNQSEQTIKQPDDTSSKQKGILKKSSKKKEKAKDKKSKSDNKKANTDLSDNLLKEESKKDVLLTTNENDSSDCYSIISDNRSLNDNEKVENNIEKKKIKPDLVKAESINKEKNVDFSLNENKSDSIKVVTDKNVEKIHQSDITEPASKSVKQKDRKKCKDIKEKVKKDDLKNVNKPAELNASNEKHDNVSKMDNKIEEKLNFQKDEITVKNNTSENLNIIGNQFDEYDSYEDDYYSDNNTESILSRSSEVNKIEIDTGKLKRKRVVQLAETPEKPKLDLGKHDSNVFTNSESPKPLAKSNSELLQSIENLPSGIRCSTLCKWSETNSSKSEFATYFCPKLSDSYLSNDLEFTQVRPQQVQIQRQLQIIKVSQLPLITENFIVKSRHVRLCIFDGIKAMSNIHVVSASVNPKDLKIWNFNSKNNDLTPSLENNDVFIRLNHTATDLSILMEFCIIGFKSKQNISNVPDVKADESFTNDDLIELSIGWTTIPIYGANGQPINNKKDNYFLNGGTPLEKGIEVNSESNLTDSAKSKISLNDTKKPHVHLRIYMPNKENIELLNLLPGMIVGSTVNLTILSFYRRILAEEILDCYQDLTSVKPVYSPFLVSFPQAAEFSDLLDALRLIWNEKLKAIKAVDKKNYRKMNEHFKNVYMQLIYPLTKLKILPQRHLGQPNVDKIKILFSKSPSLGTGYLSRRLLIVYGLKDLIRKNAIDEFLRKIKQDNLSVLLTDEYEYVPLTFEEFNYNAISRYIK